jgi:hypothetical protein|tara:strand:- start:434 stop:775 length:342 start_codon:yes stop_codon:yes gene_type:complete
MKQEYYKKKEIKEHFDDFIKEQPEDWIEENIDDIHHHAFNTDYFIIGYYQAEQWMGSASNAFDIIAMIQDYEKSNFGDVFTDLADSEKVVNMYAYIVGEEIVGEWLNKREAHE